MKAFGVLALAFLLDSIKTFYEVGNCCGLNVCDSNHVLKSEPPAAMASEAGPGEAGSPQARSDPGVSLSPVTGDKGPRLISALGATLFSRGWQ